MNTKKVVILWSVVVVVVGLILYSVVSRIIENRRVTGGQQLGISVVTSVPERGRIEEVLDYSGTLKPLHKVTVTPKVAGIIEAVYIREGELVQQNQVLVKIEDQAARLQRRQAYAAWQAALAQAEKARKGVRDEELQNAEALFRQAENDVNTAGENLQRSRNLFSAGTLSKSKFEEAENQYGSAQTDLENARRNLQMMQKGARTEEQDMTRENAEMMRARYELALLHEQDTVVKAPVSGLVARLLEEQGNKVGLSTPILVLVQDDPILATIAVPEKHYGRISSTLVREKGIRARVKSIAYPDRDPFPGILYNVGAVIDPLSRTFAVEIEVRNPQGLLRPGMYVEVELILRVQEQVLLIPGAALVQRENHLGVFSVQEQQGIFTAHFVAVETGIAQGASLQVLEGLQGNERIVVDGNAFLEDGQQIRISR